ncbi:MAG: hypothetical protein WAM79_04935 [Candidatus Sulfotelmatobacter sp.]
MGFCVSCGAPMTGAFCNKCGARAVPPSAPAQSAPPPTPVQPQAIPRTAAPAVKSSGVGKVLLWVAGIFIVLVIAGAAAAMYGVYWVKHKVSSYASAVTGNDSSEVKIVSKGDSCKLLSTAELQQILGVAVEKSAEIVEDDVPGCAYYTNAQAFGQLRQMAIVEAKKQADEVNSRPGPKPDNLPALMKNANSLEGAIKGLGLTQTPEDGRVFSFTVSPDGGEDKWAAERLIETTVPGFVEVPGVGDHAMFGAFGHAFYILKGNRFISMTTIWVPDAHTRGLAIYKRMESRL